MRHRILLAASFLYLAVANLIWIARDTRPPFWDMAVHQSAALRIYDAIAGTGLRAITAIPFLTGFYPPLYHSIVALFYSIFGKTIDAAQWANLPAIALLMVATYKIGRTLLTPLAAAAAAMLVNFYPLLLWLSRETLLDYWLSAMVAFAIWMLFRTRGFSDRNASILFGVACGLGMLTKWLFPLFVIGPAIWFARKNFRNAVIAASIAAAIAAYWYLPAGQQLKQFLQLNATGGASEGDPQRLSFQAIVFYVRALEGYQLFLPLFAAAVAGGVLLVRRFDPRWTPILLWILGGWFGLLFFQNKDPRYSAPLLPAVALVTARIFNRRERLILLLIPFLLFQHYLVSFGIPQLPNTVVILKGVTGPLSWDWNLYTQLYFGLWGRPAREDWPIQTVLRKVSSNSTRDVRLGIIPDIPRFDSQAFRLYVDIDRYPVVINQLSLFNEDAFAANDYILLSEKDQGFLQFYSPDAQRINDYILGHPESFQIVESFRLPNGDAIQLYKVNRGSVSTGQNSEEERDIKKWCEGMVAENAKIPLRS